MTRYVRYKAGDATGHGTLEAGGVRPLAGPIGAFTDAGDDLLPLSEVRLLAPVLPSKIVAAGPTYRSHFGGGAIPFTRPHFWLKPSSALLDPGGRILLPSDAPMVCFEAELGIVIGSHARNVPIERARDHIFGYTCVNDVSAGLLTTPEAFRASQYFADGKIFDTFAPIGPWIETDLDAGDLGVRCRVNGVLRQDGRTSDLIWPLDRLVSMVSQVVTLYPGDVISTGTPPGAGALNPGDTVEVEIDGIGILANSVASTP